MITTSTNLKLRLVHNKKGAEIKMRKVEELNKIGDSIVVSLKDKHDLDLQELLYITGYIKENCKEALAERKASKRTFEL